MKYSMTCTCGHVMSVDADTKENAVSKMKEMMNQEGVDAHWTQNHANEPVANKPTLEQTHAMIEQMLHEDQGAAAQM